MANTKSGAVRGIISLLGRYNRPEREFSMPWAAGATLQSPSSLKTDKFITFILLTWVGRITVAVAGATLPDAIRNIFQQIRLFGTHVQFGSQTLLKAYAHTLVDIQRQVNGSYVPFDIGALPNPSVLGATYDIKASFLIPLFPTGIDLKHAALYSVKGPDWAGNLFLEVDTGDATVLGGAAAGDYTFSAFGAAGGTPVMYVSTVRPSLTVNLMNRISPALVFKTEKTLDAVVGAAGTGSDQKLTDLNIGKRMASIWLQTGTLHPTLTANMRALATYINTVVPRSYVSLDDKSIPIEPYSLVECNDFANFIGQNQMLAGYQQIDYVRPTGNPDAAFNAEALTAARRFQLKGDVAGAATQTLSVLQEEILGTPQVG